MTSPIMKTTMTEEEEAKVDVRRSKDSPIGVVRVVNHCFRNESAPGASQGKKCITSEDKSVAFDTGSSLLFGEVLPDGVTRLSDNDHMNLLGSQVVYDLGMGCGKLGMQVFLQYPNVRYVLGIEISPSRYQIAAKAMRELSEMKSFALVNDGARSCRLLHTSARGGLRTLEFRCGDAFDILHDDKAVTAADVLFMNTDFPAKVAPKMCALLNRIKTGCRITTYNDARKIFAGCKLSPFPLAQLPINVDEDDRFYTSWAPLYGHHFYLWKRAPTGRNGSTMIATKKRTKGR